MILVATRLKRRAPGGSQVGNKPELLEAAANEQLLQKVAFISQE